jgi:Iap family predicted aminopeptidase
MTKSLTKEKNMTIKKRGRPAGVKNKPKAVKRTQVLTFEKQLEAWEKKENAVNYKELSEKLQEALAKSYVEAEQLERQIVTLQTEINARDVVIRYLESRRG